MSMLIITSEIAFDIFAWYTTCLQSRKPVSIVQKSTIKHLKVLKYLSTVSLILKANKSLEIPPDFWIIFWNVLKRSFLITFDLSRFHICYFITFWFYVKGINPYIFMKIELPEWLIKLICFTNRFRICSMLTSGVTSTGSIPFIWTTIRSTYIICRI